MHQSFKRYFVLVFLLMTGCYEQEMQLKHWAVNDSSTYFRKLIRGDAQARSHKVGSDLVERVQKIPTQLKFIVAKLNLPEPPENNPSVSGLEWAALLYLYHRDLFLEKFEQLIGIAGDLSSLEKELGEYGQICEKYFEKAIPPPVDAGALAAVSGRAGFEIYLALSLNPGSGSMGSNIDFTQNRNLVEQIVDEVINKPVGDLFSSDEEKSALQDTKKILIQNFPDDQERKEIAKDECRKVLKSVFATLDQQREFIQRLLKTTENSLSLLQSNSIQAFLLLESALGKKRQEGLVLLERERIKREIYYRRGDVLLGFFKQLDRTIIQLIEKVYLGPYSIAANTLAEAQKISRELGQYLQEDDLPLFLKKYQFYQAQIQKYEAVLKLNKESSQ